ncbi:MAG: hypothetical protein MJZ77_07035 [Bacteroidales bacterium]|mgnify:FL=1|nr:hypothetical protein [Bacteroidales bacterium]
MNKLQLDRVNVGCHPDEVLYFEHAKRFHECQYELVNNNFSIYKNERIIFSTKVELYESGHLTKTYRGTFDDGKRFRIVQPSDELMPLFRTMNMVNLTIGSMFSDGYAVSFLVEEDNNYTQPINGTLDAILKGDNNPPVGHYVFNSNTHQRYENGKPVRGEQIGCHRDIVIEKNVSKGIGYSVSINNPDAIPGSWGATPMGTKPMKIVSTSADKIEMHGYGFDRTAVAMGIPMSAATFENYRMTIFHDGLNITHCTIHMIDRNIDIDYYIK